MYSNVRHNPKIQLGFQGGSMARHYTTKDFFRQMPNALLSRYFGARGLFADLDFAGIKESKPDELFGAWLDLPDDQRNQMDAELREIFDLCCEKGFVAILDEIGWQLRDAPDEFTALVEALSDLPGHHERAMVTFLDHNEYWKGATRFHHADTLSYWRKRKHLSHNVAAVDEVSIAKLADAISGYFHYTEGRGKHCVVEPYRRGDRDYFFAYPEDYSQQEPEWVNGEIDRRPHNPAFEVVFVYSQKEGSLDLHFRGSYKAIEPLQAMFSTTILKLPELPPDPKDERVYDLNPLRYTGFDFNYAVGSGIERVALSKLRLSSRAKKGERITLEANTSEDSNAIYALLATLGKSIQLHLYNVTQVELSALIALDADKPPKSVTIRITHPNSCSLKYDEVGLRLRDMLEASSIEPKEPTEKGEPELVEQEPVEV